MNQDTFRFGIGHSISFDLLIPLYEVLVYVILVLEDQKVLVGADSLVRKVKQLCLLLQVLNNEGDLIPELIADAPELMKLNSDLNAQKLEVLYPQRQELVAVLVVLHDLNALRPGINLIGDGKHQLRSHAILAQLFDLAVKGLQHLKLALRYSRSTTTTMRLRPILAEELHERDKYLIFKGPPLLVL